MLLLLYKVEYSNVEPAKLSQRFMKTSYLTVFFFVMYADRYPLPQVRENRLQMTLFRYWRNAPESFTVMGNISTGCALVFLFILIMDDDAVAPDDNIQKPGGSDNSASSTSTEDSRGNSDNKDKEARPPKKKGADKEKKHHQGDGDNTSHTRNKSDTKSPQDKKDNHSKRDKDTKGKKDKKPTNYYFLDPYTLSGKQDMATLQQELTLNGSNWGDIDSRQSKFGNKAKFCDTVEKFDTNKLGNSETVEKICKSCGVSVGKLRLCAACQKVYL